MSAQDPAASELSGSRDDAPPVSAPAEDAALAEGSIPSPNFVLPPPPPPRQKSNRAAGSVIAVLGIVVFAVLYAVVALAIFALTTPAAGWLPLGLEFLRSAQFWLPVVLFAAGLMFLVLILNTAGWWAYVIFGFALAVLTYAAAVVGGLVHAQAWTFGAGDVRALAGGLAFDPLTIAAAVIAREVPIWVGAWIGARGRRVRAANRRSVEEYRRSLAESDRAGARGV